MAGAGALAMELLPLAAATFAGAFVQAVSGFGFAIVAAPVFLWATGSTAAIPMLVLLHLVQSAMVVPAVAGSAPRDALCGLLTGAAVGCPAGLALFLLADVRTLELSTGAVILVITALIVAREIAHRADARDARASASASAASAASAGMPGRITGVASGALTALLVMPGPPLMVWTMRAGLGRDDARALSLTFFAACYLFVALLQLAAGQLSARMLGLAVLLAPVVVAGTAAGMRFARRLSEHMFRTVVLVLLALSGLAALASGLGRSPTG